MWVLCFTSEEKIKKDVKKTQRAQRAALSNAQHPFRLFLSSSEKNNFIIDHSVSVQFQRGSDEKEHIDFPL